MFRPMKKGHFWIFINVLVLASMLHAPLVQAFTFNPNYIISDQELEDTFSLDLDGIQRYLDRGFLGDYVSEDHDGDEMLAAEIIWQAALTYDLSPKFLVVLLQKEQSLIDDDDPTENQLAWATGYAICDSCSKSDPDLQRWSGFGKQVNSAAAQFREGYLTDLEESGETTAGFGPGIPTEIDDIPVTPLNDATAALYSYTPHIAGNENFVRIWSQYFSQNYPTGSLLQARGEAGVWLIQYGERRPITSAAALHSRFDADNIIPVDETTLLQYEVGNPIAFPNYSLLQAPTGTVFLIVDDVRRGIDSMETFRNIGFNSDEIIEVTWEDLEPYEEGDIITLQSQYPQGSLLQNTATGGIYFVMEGEKHPLISRTILDENFSHWLIHPTAPELLDTYPVGDPVKLSDSTLVKAADDPSVYVISEGERRLIPTEEVFNAMGWKWENIVVTDVKTLELHPLGAVIEIEEFEEEEAEIASGL